MPTRSLCALIALIGVVVALTGCSDMKSNAGGTPMTSKRLTLAEGNAGIDRYKQEVLAALPKGATLKPIDSGPRVLTPCVLNHPEGPVETGDSWFVEGLDPSHDQQYVDKMLEHFTQLGWKPYQDGIQPGTWARLAPDGYMIRVILATAQETHEPLLSVELATPCVNH